MNIILVGDVYNLKLICCYSVTDSQKMYSECNEMTFMGHKIKLSPWHPGKFHISQLHPSLAVLPLNAFTIWPEILTWNLI